MSKRKKLPAWYSNFVVFAAEKLQRFDPDGLKTGEEIEEFIVNEIEPYLVNFLPEDKKISSDFIPEPQLPTHG